jgi:RNA polymerase primary sigma factor
MRKKRHKLNGEKDMSGLTTLSLRMQEAMQAFQITQGKLAEILKTSQAAVSHWCTGKKCPSAENLLAIADALGVTVQWLEHGTGRMKKVNPTVERGAYLQSAFWGFRPAPDDGGRDYGNANVWSFEPTPEVLVREALQNALDAALPGAGPVKVCFRLIHLRGNDLAEYRRALSWDHLNAHLVASTKNEQKLAALLREGIQELADLKEMLLLVIEDSGTTGLLGPEKDPGKFSALCRNNLDSNKEGSSTKGGAFGLGKAVFWRASRFATVIFCSNLSKPTDENLSDLRIIGRCDLPWHKQGERAFAGPGWFGMPSGSDRPHDAVSFWNNEALAKDLYVDRSKLGSGTSVCVVGYHDASSDQLRSPRDLAKDLEEFAAQHFFPALVFGDLEVSIETYEGRRQYDEQKPSYATNVRAEDLQPEYGTLLKAFQDGAVTDRLAAEGSVACRRITLEVPKRKSDPKHDEYSHEAILLVRQMGDGEPKADANKLAMFRGPGMIVELQNLAGICLGARPCHAVLMCGKSPAKACDPAARDEAADSAAEEFLRTAEPPSHMKWTSTPDLKAAYARGCRAKLEGFLSDVKEAVRDLLKPAFEDFGDGPLSLRELFRIGNEPVPSERPRVVWQDGRPDEAGRWNVEAHIRLKARSSQIRVSPAVLFVAETGGGQAVHWERIEAISGCTVEGSNLVIPPKTREARFRGTTDRTSQPIPANESCIVVDLRKVAHVSGGAQ